MATTREENGTFGSFSLSVNLTAGSQYDGEPDLVKSLEEHFADMIALEALTASEVLMASRPPGVKDGVTLHRMQGGLGGGDGFDVSYKLSLRLLADTIPFMILLEVFESVERIFQKEVLKHLTTPGMAVVMQLMDEVGPEFLEALQQVQKPELAKDATRKVDDHPGMYL